MRTFKLFERILELWIEKHEKIRIFSPSPLLVKNKNKKRRNLWHIWIFLHKIPIFKVLKLFLQAALVEKVGRKLAELRMHPETGKRLSMIGIGFCSKVFCLSILISKYWLLNRIKNAWMQYNGCQSCITFFSGWSGQVWVRMKRHPMSKSYQLQRYQNPLSKICIQISPIDKHKLTEVNQNGRFLS